MSTVKDATDTVLEELEVTLRQEFSGVNLKIAIQSFARHVELWVYVLDADYYAPVQERCRELTEEKHLEDREPEIWIVTRAWTGPWPGGLTEQELTRRRDEFRQKYGLKSARPPSRGGGNVLNALYPIPPFWAANPVSKAHASVWSFCWNSQPQALHGMKSFKPTRV